eukprot:Hpha_TRINITY_DN16011_c5_g10::TRINITY_DN16011_c5_g10_i1::g.119672::m.119672/K08857/NEK1_4_5; NIMA (never in mitosis gene a)-related kinase 1/4/5
MRSLFQDHDKYRLVRQVGQGSFGAALLVQHRENGRHFIAKELNLAQMDSKERESVDTEVGLLRALKHPNIVRYEECLQAGGALYIVMEYADGGDLYERIKALQQPMPEDEALMLFAQICLAIKHLHDRRILHRDLKTKNIFLTQLGVVKLGDFGLATCLRHTWQVAQTLCGTPNYFSPELVRGQPYANKSDIWSLGCILYELLARSFAFSANTIPDLMRKICDENPAPLPHCYSQQIAYLLKKMLAKESGIRPNIDAILRANVLQGALQGIQSLLKRQQLANAPPGVLSPTLQRKGSGKPARREAPRSAEKKRTSAAGEDTKADTDLATLADEILSDIQSDMEKKNKTPAPAEPPSSPETTPRDRPPRPSRLSRLEDGDCLMEEVSEALRQLEDKDSYGIQGPEHFGDDIPYNHSPTHPAVTRYQADWLKMEGDDRRASDAVHCRRGTRDGDERRVSLDGEVEGLLDDLEKLDEVIARK